MFLTCCPYTCSDMFSMLSEVTLLRFSMFALTAECQYLVLTLWWQNFADSLILTVTY